MLETFFQKIGEKIFDDMFKAKIDDFDKRIAVVEREIALLKKCYEDHNEIIKDVQKDLKDSMKSYSKMEGVITAFLYFKGEEFKRLDDGKNK